VDERRLTAIPLFASLSRRDARQVALVADEVEVDEGSFLVREGEFAYEFFALESGHVAVRHGDEHVADLGPGDFFGEMGLMGDLRRNASVVATERVRAAVITGSNFRFLARVLPGVCDQIRDAIAERGRALERA
jgi:CRP/FNR family cyclic AMP-dependent transcriptional regulator